MKTFSYLSNSRIYRGGILVPPEGLSTLNSKTLELAIKNKTIKEHGGKEKVEKGNSTIGTDSKEGED